MYTKLQKLSSLAHPTMTMESKLNCLCKHRMVRWEEVGRIHSGMNEEVEEQSGDCEKHGCKLKMWREAKRYFLRNKSGKLYHQPEAEAIWVQLFVLNKRQQQCAEKWGDDSSLLFVYYMLEMLLACQHNLLNLCSSHSLAPLALRHRAQPA